MFKILETYMTEILILMLVLAFLSWSGYLIASENTQTERMIIACIEAGNQVIDGDCVK
jgi:hypothetical protein